MQRHTVWYAWLLLGLVFSVAYSTSACTAPPSQHPLDPAAGEPMAEQELATDLQVPWGLTQLSDGSLLVTERDKADVLKLSGDQRINLGTVPGVRARGEGGLLGIAHKPGDDQTLFVYYTADNDNKIARMRLAGDRLVPDKVIVDQIPSSPIHNGGRLAFGPDGFLYVGTGDGSVKPNSQELSSLGGKILRIDTDGNPAPGNPFQSRIWSYGHRNVQGLAWDDHGHLYASEFGQNEWDELNLIEPGKNYGWPVVEGMASDGRFVNPLRVWKPADASPSGLAYAQGSLWLAALRGQSLWRVPLAGGEPTRLLRERHGRLRTVERAQDGRLLLVTSNTFRGEPESGDDRVLALKVN